MNTSQMAPFGPWLRQERERRGITLEEISLSTKIRVRFLEAVEQDRPDQLPSGIIGRGFVRAYANYIGIDEKQALAACLATRASTQPQPAPEPETVVKGHVELAMRLPPWVLAAGFFVISCGLVALGELRQHYQRASKSSHLPVLTTGFPPPASQTEGVKDARSTDAPESKESVPESVATNSALPWRGGLSAAAAPPSSSEADKLNLAIKVRQDAWMSVIADGHRVLSETLVAPTERSVEAYSHIVVRAGNIGAVDFSFNGHSLPIQGDYGEARTLRFDADGLQTRFPAAVPLGTEQDAEPKAEQTGPNAFTR
jgi:cytoskeletal protein RodZ